jgi:tetratricopeptide (TPR) repeat protein
MNGIQYKYLIKKTIERLLFIVLLFVSINGFSQGLREGLKAKNDGNNAYKAKNYAGAISFWENYFGSGEESAKTDSNTIFLYQNSFKYAAFDCLKNGQWSSSLSYFEKYIRMNREDSLKNGEIAYCMAYCAYKTNKSDVALIYFQKSIDLNYQPDLCKLYLASIYKNLGYEQNMKDILIGAINQYPQSKQIDNMTSMLVYPLLKEAAIPFNMANEYAKKASVDTTQYQANVKIACAKFEEAIPLFEKVLKYSPTNELAITYLKVCHEFLEYYNENKTPAKKE